MMSSSMATTPTNIIIDSNVFIASNWIQDPNHDNSLKILRKISSHNQIVIVNNYIISEVATVLLLRTKDVDRAAFVAKSMYQNKRTRKLYQLTKDNQLEILEIFASQQSPKLSFTDCSILWQAKKHNANIATFDKHLLKVHQSMK